MPGTSRVASASRCATSAAPARRCASGTSVICSRPALSVVFAPSTPMNEATLCTAGSCRMRAASARWCSAIAANDVDCAASVMPWSWPVSCSGKKPLGTSRYSAAVSASVSAKTTKRCDAVVEHPIEQPAVGGDRAVEGAADGVRHGRPSSRSGRSKRAHIIGVSVSDTKAEIRIATASVIANSWNSAPDHVAHEQQRDQHRDQRYGERDDREADLPRAFERGGDGNVWLGRARSRP